MKIATWNVNSIKVRLEHLIKWMELSRIDAVVLQETKTVDELFPLAELQATGFDAVFSWTKNIQRRSARDAQKFSYFCFQRDLQHPRLSG